MALYHYEELIDKTKIPDDATDFVCYGKNLTELPKLPIELQALYCDQNNIKYLSPNNLNVIKSIKKRSKNNVVSILNNPISEGFDSEDEFMDNL
jgi:hypothetical protein